MSWKDIVKNESNESKLDEIIDSKEVLRESLSRIKELGIGYYFGNEDDEFITPKMGILFTRLEKVVGDMLDEWEAFERKIGYDGGDL